MNDFNSGRQPPLLYPAPKKPFPIAAVILTFAVLLILLAIVGGIKAFQAAKSGSAAAISVGNSFVDDLGRHNYPAAQALFTPELQTKTPATTLQDVETLVEKHHGAYVAHGQPQWFIQNYNGQTSVRLSYPAQYSKSSSTVSLIVMQTDKGYQISDAHYDF